MLSDYTKNLSEYVKKRGINLSKMARDTGLSYSALYGSLIDSGRKRDLRDYEFMGICIFLGVDPRDFADKEAVEGGEKR
ncbi:XRE family transcriptional regulator [bacterium C-53]|nr:XRE family transcriptional regulator [Lachnospiraceae bacterium]NBI02959.1 XRE family transcriptional regulator [Lachnospiraceae bacterium]RKJ10580.1 XRE family transcriptional regulator [bacterium C-53]